MYSKPNNSFTPSPTSVSGSRVGPAPKGVQYPSMHSSPASQSSTSVHGCSASDTLRVTSTVALGGKPVSRKLSHISTIP